MIVLDRTRLTDQLFIFFKFLSALLPIGIECFFLRICFSFCFHLNEKKQDLIFNHLVYLFLILNYCLLKLILRNFIDSVWMSAYIHP